MKTVYLCGPITGLTLEQATIWRNNAKMILRAKNLRCIDPMEGEPKTKVSNSRFKDIVALDYFYVNESNIIFANFEHYGPECSIGSVSELAWAYHKNKIIIAVVPEDSPYKHPWLKQFYTYTYNNYKEALKKVLEIQ